LGWVRVGGRSEAEVVTMDMATEKREAAGSAAVVAVAATAGAAALDFVALEAAAAAVPDPELLW
jgi:hypothetical protein